MKSSTMLTLLAGLMIGCGSPESQTKAEPPEQCNYGYIGCEAPGDACFLQGSGRGVCRGSCETTLECCFGCWDGAECRYDLAACGTEGEACAEPAPARDCAREGDACTTPEGAAGTCVIPPDKCELGCISN